MSAEPRVRLREPAPNVVVVAEALREALVAGRFGAGERIKEIPLSEQLGVSRGRIRAALRLLANDGLIEIPPNRGAVVPAIHAADVLEVYALRASIGSLALRKLMLDPSAAADARLAKALGAFERAVARRDERRAATGDLAFQSAMVDGAGLGRVSREFEQLTWQVRQFIAMLDARYEDKLSVMLAEVRALHDAIGRRELACAEALWRDKLERWVRDFVERLPDEGFDAELWVALTAGRPR